MKVIEVEIILMQDTVLKVSGVITSVRSGGECQRLHYAYIDREDSRFPPFIVRMDDWYG